MDELYEMLLTLKGYGEANDMHVVIFKRDCNNLSIFASAFGLRMEIFKKNDRFVDPFLEDEFFYYASYLKALYDDNILTDKSLSIDSYGTLRDDFGKGKSISIVMWDNIHTSLATRLNKNDIPDYEIMPLPAFATDHGVFGIEYVPPGEPFVITKSCKNKDKAFKST